MAFCTNCGKKLNPGARFCTFCGTQVRSVEPVNASAFTPDFSGNANQGAEEAPKQETPAAVVPEVEEVPAAEEPAIEEAPAAEETAAEEPAVEAPASEETAVEEPATEEDILSEIASPEEAVRELDAEQLAQTEVDPWGPQNKNNGWEPQQAWNQQPLQQPQQAWNQQSMQQPQQTWNQQSMQQPQQAWNQQSMQQPQQAWNPAFQQQNPYQGQDGELYQEVEKKKSKAPLIVLLVVLIAALLVGTVLILNQFGVVPLPWQTKTETSKSDDSKKSDKESREDEDSDSKKSDSKKKDLDKKKELDKNKDKDEKEDAQVEDGEVKGQIFPHSAEELLTEDQIKALSDKDLRLAINEIYARHGYAFTTKEMQDYYGQLDWYENLNKTQDEVNAELTTIEYQNKEMLTKERDSRVKS